MKKSLNIVILILLVIIQNNNVNAQFVAKVIEYLPAPGQYTNTEALGTPQAANSIIGTNDGLVSLGAFGGSIVFGFDEPVENDPGNPYGIDFTIYGNATSTWSEPGIVYVMKDENGNGEPDDTWYEIAGSDYYRSSTIENYSITYFNNGLGPLANVLWTDNQGRSGMIPVNSYHQQPYYPLSSIFPDIPSDQWQLSGTRIAGNIDLSNSIMDNSYPRAFGYADNKKVISFTDPMPDNPYTQEIEGSGGDAIDIDWAVDIDGNHVKIDAIDFIKIMTGMNDVVGWLGEVSTEIAGIRDVDPAVTVGETRTIVMNDLPGQLMINDSLDLEALYYESGILVEEQLQWSVSNPALAKLDGNRLFAKGNGTITVSVQCVSDVTVLSSHTLTIYSPGEAIISLESNGVLVNDRIELTGKVTDQDGKTIQGLKMEWISGDESVFEITELDGQPYLLGKSEGEAWLNYVATEYDEQKDSVLIKVYPESEKKKVYISVKSNDKTLIPRQALIVDRFDLSSFVDRAQFSYGVEDIEHVSLAHVIAALFNSIDMEVNFRDDERADNSLYLWKLPEEDDGSVVYHYGYGGSKEEEAYRKTWVVSHNQAQYVTGLDKVAVNNEDEILVYHVPDNSIQWSYSHMSSNKDSLELYESTVIQLMEFNCLMDDERNVHINSSDVLAYQQVNLEAFSDQKSVHFFTTDEAGQLTLSFDEAGEYSLSSGSNSIKLIVEEPTDVTSRRNIQSFQVYPNPCFESLWIKTPETIYEIMLYSTGGTLLIHLYNFDDASISVASFPSGVYLLNVVSESGTSVYKIIKK